MAIQAPIFSVNQVNQHIKNLLDGDELLSGLFVRGEISNYKCYPTGHHYFSLKDTSGAIRCVMFKREAVALKFRPQNGMKVLAFGRVSAFPRDGQYQLYCTHLAPDGVGDLHAAFEALKERLSHEGLFEEEHKKPIPLFPERIALITSSAGAAVRDMLRILEARWPMTQVVVLPVRVQGVEAPREICGALAWANHYKVADLIITGRGGGSMEDLWAFNDEGVARAIFASDIPVISAVGHEPDVTIADYVADLRAATPSNAAELAVPDQNEMYANLAQLQQRMGNGLGNLVTNTRRTLNYCTSSRALQNPMMMVDERRVLVDYQRTRLAHSLSATLSKERGRTASLAAGLDAMSPLKVLARGYAIAQKEDGTVIRSKKSVAAGDTLNVRVKDGVIPCTVKGSLSDG